METGEPFMIFFLPWISTVFSTYNKVSLRSVSLIFVIIENRTFVYLLLLSHAVHFLERILNAFVISYFSAQLFIALPFFVYLQHFLIHGELKFSFFAFLSVIKNRFYYHCFSFAILFTLIFYFHPNQEQLRRAPNMVPRIEPRTLSWF